MDRREFLASTLTGLGAAATFDNVKEVLVMFKCHLDVGFVDTQAAIIRKYFSVYFPRAIERAQQQRTAGTDAYVWTTGSWLVYEYLEQAKGAGDRARRHCVACSSFYLAERTSGPLRYKRSA